MNDNTKVCTDCGVEKPATPEFFYRAKECTYGVMNRCKVCQSAWSKSRGGRKTYEAQQQATLRRNSPRKICTKCGEEFDRTNAHFYNQASSPDGLNSQCKPCVLNPKLKPRDKPLIVESEVKLTCRQCGTQKSMTDSYFPLDKSTPLGFKKTCKACYSINKKKMRQGEPTPRQAERQKLKDAGLKKCSKCGEAKPETLEFFYRLDADSGKYFSRCIPCVSGAEAEAGKFKDGRERPLTLEDPSRTKTCTTCYQDKPATKEFFAPIGPMRRLLGRCRACDLAIKKSRCPVPIERPGIDMECSGCGSSYPRTLEFWHKRTSTHDGMNTKCKKCILQQQAQAKKKKSAGICGNSSKIYTRVPTPRHLIDWPKKILEVPLETEIALVKERAINSASGNNHRAKKMGIEGRWTKEGLEKIYWRQEGRCPHCTRRMYSKVEFDHVVPLTRNGLNTEENCEALCPSCNGSKNDKLLHEWSGPIAVGFQSDPTFRPRG